MPQLRHRAILAAVAAGLAAAAGACIENIPKPSSTVASVAVAPESCQVMQGDTLTLVAIVRNAEHAVLSGIHVGWTSSDLGVVTVTVDGLIRAVGPGTATVTASAEAAWGRTVVTVIPRIVALRITPDGVTLVPGGSFPFVADGIGTSGAVIARLSPAWSSSDTAVATVDAAGVATAHGTGAAWVIARDGTLAESVLVRAATVRFTTVSAGPYQSTCATGPDGAYCWGYDGNAGNLGAGVGLAEDATALLVSAGLENPTLVDAVDGKVMSWVYKLKSMDLEAPIITLYRDMMLLERSAARSGKINKTAAAINHWMIHDRTDLPLGLTQMSFASYTKPVDKDGNLPVKLFGRQLNFKRLQEKGIKWLICIAEKDDLIDEPAALAPLDYIEAEVSVFPKGHGAIATSWSLPTSECALHTCFCPANTKFGDKCRGPVVYHLDLDTAGPNASEASQ